MRVVRTIAEMRGEVGGGFVPTMGALHEGHLSLIRASAAENGRTVVSIFVNPLQFAPHEDLAQYPRPFERDVELADASGADVVFSPSVEEMFPAGATTRVGVGPLATVYEGAVRPGHFDGVATVVARLFGIVRPDVAYFGWKDLQQCAVIERMTGDLAIPVALRFGETVREADGLARSSRNVYLSPDERARAVALPKALAAAREKVTRGITDFSEEKKAMEAAGFRLDYFDLVRYPDFVPTDEPAGSRAIIVAAKIGNTRLLDNVRFDAS